MNKKQIYSIAIGSALGSSFGTTIGVLIGNIAMTTVYGSLISICLDVVIVLVF